MIYRADIDGLRAVSILLILIYHVSNSVMPGGFVGVDVFFVISGYLITRLISAALEAHSFSFVDFYARRVRRIFPAVLLVLVSTLAVGWNSLFAHEFMMLGKHVAASAGFVSNIVYQFEGGYFDLKSVEKPLLHLWSLAIEEQFYFVWPLVLWTAWRLGSTVGGGDKKRLLAVISGVGALSLLLSAILSWGYPQYVFYFLPTRAWELCAGALLVALPPVSGRFNKGLCATVGLAMIGSAAVFFSHDLLYPGWAAFIPVLGAMAVIAAGPHTWVNHNVLSLPLLVHLGKWSFSIYLWHWPLLYFVRTLGWEVLFPWSPWAVVPVSILLAALTFQLIEEPAKRLPLRAGAAGLMICMALTGFVGWNIFVRHGLDFRERMVIENIGGVPAESSEGCLVRFEKYKPKFCRIQDEQRPIDVILLGDSMGHNAFPGMAQAYAEAGKNLAMVGWPGVAPLLLEASQLNSYEGDVGLRLNSLLQDVGADVNGPQVVFAFRLPHEMQPDIAERLEPTLDYFVNNGRRKVLYVLEPPSLPFAPILCVGMPPLRPQIEKACQLPLSELSATYTDDRVKVMEMLRQRDISIFDAHETLCDSSTCKLTLDGHIIYRTTRYLTEEGSRHVYGRFLSQVKKP